MEALISCPSAGGDTRDEQRIWQPYADYLVYIVLMALPWGGPDLAETAPAEMEKLLAEAEKYMDLRPTAHTPGLRPFFEGDDPASTSDSGAASFLGQVWEAVQEMNASASWKVESIPAYVGYLNEAELATGKPHNLAPLSIPRSPPCLPAAHTLANIEVASYAHGLA